MKVTRKTYSSLMKKKNSRGIDKIKMKLKLWNMKKRKKNKKVKAKKAKKSKKRSSMPKLRTKLSNTQRTPSTKTI